MGQPNLPRLYQELQRLGWSQNHRRIVTWLQKLGVTCLEAAPAPAIDALIAKLSAIEEVEDHADVLAAISVQLDRLGLRKEGVWVKLWCQHLGCQSISDLDADRLDTLLRFLKNCKSDGYTIPIRRDLKSIATAIDGIIDTLKAGAGSNTALVQRLDNIRLGDKIG